MDELGLSFKWLAAAYIAVCSIACYAVHCLTRSAPGGPPTDQLPSRSEHEVLER